MITYIMFRRRCENLRFQNCIISFIFFHKALWLLKHASELTKIQGILILGDFGLRVSDFKARKENR